MNVDEAFVPKLASKARFTFDRHDQKHMIMYPERGLVLNDSGADVVKRFDGMRTLGQIIDDLCTEACAGYNPPPREQIAADVIGFVTMLRDKGLLG